MAKFFIDRPVFAWVISIIIMGIGILSILTLPIAQYPQIAPPSVTVAASYPGASAETVANTVTQVMEQQMTGLDGLRYFSSSSTSSGLGADHPHLRDRDRPRHRTGAGAEPAQPGDPAPAGGRPAPGHHGAQVLRRLPDGDRPHLRERNAGAGRPVGLPRLQHRRRDEPRRRRRPGARCSAPSTPCASGSTPPSSPPTNCRRKTSSRPSPPRTRRSPQARSARCPPSRGRC